VLKKVKKSLLASVDESLTLAVIYTIGHILIAICVVRTVTSSSWWDAGLVALIEPAINGVWFYFLHRIWREI